MPNLYIISGPNGAGKTTASLQLLPQFLNCKEYVNADAIASGLSPFNSDAVAIQAGRLMLKRIEELASQKIDFAFETTLASRSFAPFIKKCKKEGYTIVLIYFYLHSDKLAIQRVAERVAGGGHDIPSSTITRRYSRSLKNLISLYLNNVDEFVMYDNSYSEGQIQIAEKKYGSPIHIIDNKIWQEINSI